MKILFATSEAYPLLKTGGLGDVAGALPTALAKGDDDVRIIMPAYPQALNAVEGKRDGPGLGDPLGAGEARLIEARMPGSGVPVWLVDCPALFDRPGNPYVGPDGRDWPDNHLRFAMLSRAAAMLSMPGNASGWTPDVVHANDWQTGLIPAYLHYWGGRRARTVFTVHNLQYQGLFPATVLGELGLPPESYSIEGLEFHGQVSFLKAGLFYSDALTTVSPTYAREIQTSEYGCGMEGLLRLRAGALTGVLNGIDTDDWNPEKDSRIPKPYSATRLAGKTTAKALLQREMGLPEDPGAPLFGMVSRLTSQKGIDFVVEVAPKLVARGAQVAILGSGDKVWEDALRKLAVSSPGVSVSIGYDESLAHRIIAGADIFMMPSRFEPCGLTQMYALRYGTLPLVHHTGGLADTVEDVGGGRGTGFVFNKPESTAVAAAAFRALKLYDDKKAWKETQARAMSRNSGWEMAAQSYKELYTTLVQTRHESP
ncbi:MAG: glycogen synthase GlgA [Rhodospirillales bacterium]|nr:glycogen synthase GlgA [Rhodospirillales bacterium]MCW8952528.1 glycogen synthase GlgA [Rhodospirillales bacterium]MCW8970025.1 glycogen synthase GlgA [Rhodospirillales bacterium]MCW9001357.1 glycogen synthase GlgA [Rhodospirillales bacterium]